MIEIRINNEKQLLRFGDEKPILVAELARHGYHMGLPGIRRHDQAVIKGRIQRSYSIATHEIVYMFTPGRRDILFKKFKRPLTPWQETKNIRFRRFK